MNYFYQSNIALKHFEIYVFRKNEKMQNATENTQSSDEKPS